LVTQLPLVAAGQAGSELVARQDGGAQVRRSILPGGVRVITEKIPGLRSATIGAWISVGSRDESPGSFGAAHYLEHLLFKGTGRRSAKQIAQEFDGAGAEANAVTGKEHTCYYARVLDRDVPMALDVICDMLTSALLDTQEFERERGVILEEIAMHADDPGDTAFENFSQAVFRDHALGRQIAGTTADIEGIESGAVTDFYRRHYASGALVIAAAGGVEHEEITELVTERLAAGGWKLEADEVPLGLRSPDGQTPTGASVAVTIHRPDQQANLILGRRGITAVDERRYQLAVLHSIFGSGMSSRLFQTVREELGLAYSVHSFSTGYADAGTFGVYAGCAPENIGQVVEVIQGQWSQLIRDGVSQEELTHAQGQVCGGLVLGLEDSSARMSRLARAELTFGELWSVEEVLQQINAVKIDDIVELAMQLDTADESYVVVGPIAQDLGEVLNISN